MKLSHLTAKLTCGKAKVLGVVGGLALAGALFTAAAPGSRTADPGFVVHVACAC